MLKFLNLVATCAFFSLFSGLLFCRNRSVMCYPFLLSECLSPLGLASEKLPDSALAASSEVRS